MIQATRTEERMFRIYDPHSGRLILGTTNAKLFIWFVQKYRGEIIRSHTHER